MPSRRSLLFILLASTALAQTPVQVGDLLTTGSGQRNTEAYSGVALGAITLFPAKLPATGLELWTTDGTAAGTALLTDLLPGPRGSFPNWLTRFGGFVYFTASDGLSGDQLWRTDGTVAGTTLVSTNRCSPLLHVGTRLWCVNDSSVWTTDGTTTVTASSASFRGRVSEGSAMGDTLFYAGNDGELWKSDGTTGGTVRVRDLRPGSSTFSLNSPIVSLGSRVYFAADDGVSGLELWSSDGTQTGTTLVRDINAGATASLVSGITVQAKLWVTSTRILFLANTSAGIELWSSDGTSAGTVLVADLTAGTGNTFSATSELMVFQDQLFFSGGDGELWKSDGTSVGTVQVKDLLPGTSRANPTDWFAAGSNLYFSARNAGGFSELWRSDGTPAGTLLLKPRAQLAPGLFIGPVGTRAMFLGNDAVHGAEPWLSDGTAIGTTMLADLNPGVDYAFSSPHALAKLGTALLFVARTTAGPLHLYRSNGTAAGTTVLKTGLSSVEAIVSNGTRAWFVSQRNQLWTTDGTAAGTVMLKQFGTLTFDDSARELTLLGQTLAFTGYETSTGWELWTSDGSAAGTRLVKDLVAGPTGGGPYALAVMSNTLYFWLSGTTGAALWKSDLTNAGTVLIKDVSPAFVNGMVTFGNRLAAWSTRSLWTSDGTATGTTSFDVGGATLQLERLEVLGTSLIIRANETNASGVLDDVAELWSSDGSVTGTRKLAPLGLPSLSGFSATGWADNSSVVVGNRLVLPFASRHVAKLWVTDGTALGTTPLKDLAGPDRSDVDWRVTFGVAGGLAYFAASDGLSGSELWRTDGTSVGTTRVADVIPGAGSFSPSNALLVEPYLAFSAFDANGDEELWSLDLGLDTTPPVITPMVTGTMGLDGWYTSNVAVSFSLVDPESPITMMPGCAATTLSTDTMGVTFTCTATSRGGTSMATVMVKRDATPPVMMCAPAQVAEATSPSGAMVSFAAATAMDALSATTTPMTATPSGSTFALGDALVTFTSLDAAGNPGSCTTTVSVVDTVAPVITCPANSTVGGTFATLTAKATAIDTADAAPVVTQSLADGAPLTAGANAVTATATDASGNQSTCTFTVTFESGAPPPMPTEPTGCGCTSGGSVLPLALLALALRRLSRRKRSIS